jgi:hypothetical protein
VLTCGGVLATPVGTAASRTVTGTDPDDTIVDLALTSVVPAPATGSITRTAFAPAGAPGGTANATITASDDLPVGSYAVTVTSTDGDGTTATCGFTVQVQGVAGLRETLREWVQAMLKRVRPQHMLPLGVMSFDGKSLYTGTREVAGLESVKSDEAGTALWRLGALRAALTSVPGAPCVDLEFIGAKEGESPAFRQLLPRVVEHFGEHFQVVTGDAGLCAA